ncbi:hypothetical protein BH10PSE12_BH10PSE12_13870 [soil metagenome]
MKHTTSFRERITGLLCLAAFVSIAAGLAGLAPYDARAMTPIPFAGQAATTADMAALKLAMERE